MKIVNYTAVLLLLISVIITWGINTTLKKERSKENIVVDLLEHHVSNKELANLADIIVEGTFLSQIDQINYESDEIHTIIGIYSFDIIRELIGNTDLSNNIYISFGGTVLPRRISPNTNYLVLLKKSGLTYDNKDVYSFVSISQGIFEVNGRDYINGSLKYTEEEFHEEFSQ